MMDFWSSATARPDLIVPALIAVLGLWLTAHSIRSQTQNSRVEKIADVLIACSDRFHAIDSVRDEIEAKLRRGELSQEEACERYFFEYWHFQWDQWNYFKLGLIPHEMYADWFYQRLVIVRLGSLTCGITFLEGWQKVRRHFETYEDFSVFVDNALALAGAEDAVARRKLAQFVDRAFRQARPMRRGFARRSTGGWA
ncbi:MAG: hypothetical protein JNL81_05645 [Hyphomonadaceae bacterium]|nr:hypothetical protein [Hyphomonadaceae bacterium]